MDAPSNNASMAQPMAHDPVVEVVVHLLLVIDTRLERAQLRLPYGRRGTMSVTAGIIGNHVKQ